MRFCRRCVCGNWFFPLFSKNTLYSWQQTHEDHMIAVLVRAHLSLNDIPSAELVCLFVIVVVVLIHMSVMMSLLLLSLPLLLLWLYRFLKNLWAEWRELAIFLSLDCRLRSPLLERTMKLHWQSKSYSNKSTPTVFFFLLSVPLPCRVSEGLELCPTSPWLLFTRAKVLCEQPEMVKSVYSALLQVLLVRVIFIETESHYIGHIGSHRVTRCVSYSAWTCRSPERWKCRKREVAVIFQCVVLLTHCYYNHI